MGWSSEPDQPSVYILYVCMYVCMYTVIISVAMVTIYQQQECIVYHRNHNITLSKIEKIRKAKLE